MQIQAHTNAGKGKPHQSLTQTTRKLKRKQTHYTVKPTTPMTPRHINTEIVKKIKEKMDERLDRVKRDATMLTSLARSNEEEEEEKEEEEEERTEIEGDMLPSGDRAIPPPGSNHTQVVDYLTFIKEFKHAFESDQDSPIRRRRRKRRRQKRDVGAEENRPDGMEVIGSEQQTPGKVKEVRLVCNRYYIYFELLAKERKFSEDESHYVNIEEVMMMCTKDDYRTIITFNPICNMEVVCDNYGCFDYRLNRYNETVNETHRCPSCANGRCWEEEWVVGFENETLSPEQVSGIFEASRTLDFSDLLGLYSPSKEDIRRFSPEANNFIKTCSYDRRPCSSNQFHMWISDVYGMCYTFNSVHREIQLRKNNKTVKAKARKTTSTGPLNGLRLTLNVNEDQYLSLLSPDIGVRVIVHSPHQLPFPEEEGFNVSPDNSVSVKMSRKIIQRVGYPHGRCRADSGSSIFKEYSSLGCRKLCVEEEIWRQCNCYVGKSPTYHRDELPMERPGAFCSPYNVRRKLCVEMVRYSYLKGQLHCDCPPSCGETVYHPEVTISQDNKKFFTILQNLKKLKVDDSICESNGLSPVRLHLYMDSLSYEKIEESPAYTWDTLICNVGGNLGLFLGMSIVTVVELFEFLFDLVMGCCRPRGRRDHPNHIVTPLQAMNMTHVHTTGHHFTTDNTT
ncbi:amiloride-sensitive sodium channel subunit alpha-like isoform X2 [Eriocheir sinensis]|uniref:amiloride-sensitive sodium channel subunit alpha-like isoform X2 n=1 Tax=Eriocheir sinensis TaxID=95602 RepID=UPI0021CAB84F|nr:amiloride-sensitive sodium channel subunit alpha-like isoform X2 [Eriocheir sinensis]